jgi:septal ring factor EnvC (AmiA/AmiB activator)
MFILSSDNYNEASKRTKYLKKVAGIQKKQMALILQHRSLINKELNQIKEEKETKSKALEEKKIEREQITKDKFSKEKTYQKFKQEEQKLYAQLKEDERKKEELKQKINAAIRADIARQEAERARKEAEALKKREADAKKKKEQEELARKNKEKEKGKTPSTTTTPEKTPEKEPEETKAPVFVETSEGSVAGKNFESNKGRLPAPVSSGSIVESFGRNAHPTLPDVFTNNNGVDYACSKGANVRAIFEGEVTSVFSITGAGKVVIIKHGNYRSVYSNLKETYVSIGSKVSTKQAIGSLMIDGNVSVCHFEIHQIVNGVPKCLNPQLWVGR